MQDRIKRGGRRPKPKRLKQSERAMVTFTPAEYREVRRAAGVEPVGTYIRATVLRDLALRREQGDRT